MHADRLVRLARYLIRAIDESRVDDNCESLTFRLEVETAEVWT